MSLALAQLLPEFHLPNRQQAMVAAKPANSGPSDLNPAMIDKIRSEGFEEGFRQARDELLALHATEIEALQATYQTELEVQATKLVTEVVQAVPAALAAREETLLTHLSNEIAAVLAPLVSEITQRQMVDALVGEIRAALDIKHAAKIVITGPEVWLQAMRTSLGADMPNVEFRPSETADIEVTMDQTRLSTRFASLEEQMREAIS